MKTFVLWYAEALLAEAKSKWDGYPASILFAVSPIWGTAVA